jgi:UDP-2-acetamido-2,6-beta-L-arabino-hexul-4-ose reductase
MKIGVTGQSGFIGHHLIALLSLKKDIQIIPFQKSFFDEEEKLGHFLSECDVVVHLAGKNRGSEDDIYQSNIELASKIIKSLEKFSAKPQLIFSSSIQENQQNAYGRSKKGATDLFIDWAKKNNALFSSLIIPNVFGPFCKPFYNSVIATFCYQLTHDQQPKIDVDKPLKLIYINDLVDYIYRIIEFCPKEFRLYPEASAEASVKDLLSKLQEYKEIYYDDNIIPSLNDHFHVCLFNTFRSYIEPTHFPIKATLQSDERGILSEIVKEQTGGQAFYSLTNPRKTRGNHYHRRKIERFFVIKGAASLKLRKIGSTQVTEYIINADENPAYVDIPLFFAHNITNIGVSELITLFWTNELFNKDDSDTYPQIV